MGKQFHVNKEGTVGKCRARKHCPLMPLAAHANTAEAARAYFEAVMEGKEPTPLRWMLSSGSTVESTLNPQAMVGALYSEHLAQMEPFDGHHGALGQYRMDHHEEINATLRKGDVLPPELAREVKELDGLFESVAAGAAPSRRVFRVVMTDQSPAAYAKALVGKQTYSDAGFMSTSASPEFVASIAAGNYSHWKGNRVVFEIVTRGGVSCQDDPEWTIENFGSKECEVLLPRGQSFQVVGAEEKTFKFGSFLDHCEGEWRDGAAAAGEVKCMVVQMVAVGE